MVYACVNDQGEKQMSEIQLECQGLPCPQPVLKCKEAIESQSPAMISVTVDNEAAKQSSLSTLIITHLFLVVKDYFSEGNFYFLT